MKVTKILITMLASAFIVTACDPIEAKTCETNMRLMRLHP